jgi:hypothetical protein
MVEISLAVGDVQLVAHAESQNPDAVLRFLLAECVNGRNNIRRVK